LCGARSLHRWHEGNAGYMVWCENGDYKLTARGI
jgi:hypothetical protein